MSAAPTRRDCEGLTTEIASHDLDHIWIRGHDLTNELMGHASFTDVVYLLLAGRLPTHNDRTLIDAVLVALVEHGLTPSAAVSRVTFATAPEALQPAVAAGLLGAGSRVLGSMDECGRLLDEVVGESTRAGDLLRAARVVISQVRDEGRRVPGIGHAIHRGGDPRAARLFEVAATTGHRGIYVEAIEAVATSASEQVGKALPVNATGAVAAVLLELGVPWQLHRGFALISRTPGLLAHIAEEMENPITPTLRAILHAGASPAKSG